MPTRRELLQALLCAPAGAAITFGQNPPPAIQATRLAPDLALITGDGGNMAVAIAPDGLLLVDGGFAERSSDLLKIIADQVDTHQIRLVFNTHWHVDHVGCNEVLGRAGAKIMSHENVKKRLSTKITMEALNRTFEPLKPEGLPSQTFSKGGKLSFGKEKIEYMRVAPAHTDGDSYLFFTGANVLHAGDLLFNGFYPLIDYSTGGWVGGMAAACDTLMKVGDAQTRIIPGHGPMATKDQLKASRDMLATVHERLEKMAKEGKPVEEVVESAPTKDLDNQWAKGSMKPDQFTRIAYSSILRHQKGS